MRAAAATLLGLALLAPAGAQDPPDKTRYWFSPAPPLTRETLDFYKSIPKEEWFARFDSMIALVFPPTFSTWGEVQRGAADLAKALGSKFRAASLTVGKKGWESSHNERAAQKHGAALDRPKNLEPGEWFKSLAAATKASHVGLSIELLTPGKVKPAELGKELTANVLESVKGVPKGGTFALWMTLAFEEFQGRDAILETVKNVKDKVDYFVWMDTRVLFEKHGMDLCRRRVKELIELCGRDKTVIQLGCFQKEFSPYPAEFMRMCREEGVRTFFLYVAKQLPATAEWKRFVSELKP